jgi:alkylation response protein AidB-like acyl-CoA dehydrogenase
MAAIQATALRDGDHFVLNGQKTWASRGAYAHWLFGLFRTDPESERHRGLSFLLVPLDLPGVTVRPIEKLNHKAAFAEIFLDDARVPAANREPAGRGGAGLAGGDGDGGLRARAHAAQPGALPADRGEAGAALPREPGPLRAPAAPRGGRVLDRCRGLHPRASLNKIFWSELDLRMHETALEILGPRAELLPSAPAAEGVGEWLDGYLFALAGPIYAGTNEIQRNVIAERILGLPRS